MINDETAIAATKEQPTKQSRWWPAVDTEANARKVVRQAFWVTVFVAAVTAAFAAYAAFSGKPSLLGIDAWAFMDSFVFGVLAIFVFRGSRVATILALALYVLESFMTLSETPGTAGIAIRVLFTLWLIHGVRGAFALRQRRTTPGVTTQPSLDGEIEPPPSR